MDNYPNLKAIVDGADGFNVSAIRSEVISLQDDCNTLDKINRGFDGRLCEVMGFLKNIHMNTRGFETMTPDQMRSKLKTIHNLTGIE